MLLNLIVGSGIKAVTPALQLGLDVIKLGEEKLHRSVEREYFRNHYSVLRTDSFLRYCSDEDRNQIAMNNVDDEIGAKEFLKRMYTYTVKR